MKPGQMQIWASIEYMTEAGEVLTLKKVDMVDAELGHPYATALGKLLQSWEPESTGLVLVKKSVVEDLLDYHGRTCRLDHHGLCQEHGLQEAADCFVKGLVEALGQTDTLTKDAS